MQHTNLKSKLNAILPLLDVSFPEYLKSLSFELKIRHEIIHNKALPEEVYLPTNFSDKRPSSDKRNVQKAEEIFSRIDLKRVKKEFENFYFEAMSVFPFDDTIDVLDAIHTFVKQNPKQIIDVYGEKLDNSVASL